MCNYTPYQTLKKTQAWKGLSVVFERVVFESCFLIGWLNWVKSFWPMRALVTVAFTYLLNTGVWLVDAFLGANSTTVFPRNLWMFITKYYFQIYQIFTTLIVGVICEYFKLVCHINYQISEQIEVQYVLQECPAFSNLTKLGQGSQWGISQIIFLSLQLIMIQHLYFKCLNVLIAL